MRPYTITLLLHPQAPASVGEELESAIRTWVEERGGTFQSITQETKRRLAYPIQHVHQATYAMLRFELPPTDLTDLRERLQRQKKVLRFVVYQHAPRREGKTLKDLSLHPASQAEKPIEGPKKEKASLEHLDEKIEKILGEEVL